MTKLMRNWNAKPLQLIIITVWFLTITKPRCNAHTLNFVEKLQQFELKCEINNQIVRWNVFFSSLIDLIGIFVHQDGQKCEKQVRTTARKSQHVSIASTLRSSNCFICVLVMKSTASFSLSLTQHTHTHTRCDTNRSVIGSAPFNF